MELDDSFTTPGAVPFKWEIRPGVPKVQPQQQPKQLKQRQSPPLLPPPSSPFISLRSLPSPPPASTPQRKLKPPPAGSYYILSPEPRSYSFSFRSTPSTPRSRTGSFRFENPARFRPEYVSSGCFPTPSLKRKGSKRRAQKLKPEPDYASDLETRSRWSVSSRRSVSPFYSSPASSFSSFRSSPRPVADVEWAGFGFF